MKLPIHISHDLSINFIHEFRGSNQAPPGGSTSRLFHGRGPKRWMRMVGTHWTSRCLWRWYGNVMPPGWSCGSWVSGWMPIFCQESTGDDWGIFGRSRWMLFPKKSIFPHVWASHCVILLGESSGSKNIQTVEVELVSEIQQIPADSSRYDE